MLRTWQPPSVAYVVLQFKSLAILNGYVTVYDGTTASDPLVGNFTAPPATPIVSSANALYINFNSGDGSLSSLELTGFVAEYFSVGASYLPRTSS